MGRYVTLGADENGEVYGLEVDETGKWKRNPLGLSTSCAVIRPMTRASYEYLTEDPRSAKEVWKICVADDRTELGLEEWFEEYTTYDDQFDASFVFELLDDNDNPTITRWCDDRVEDGDHKFEAFRGHVEATLVRSPEVPAVTSDDDVYDWECAGWFPPKKPFVVEFAPKELLEEYYAHLRETSKEFEG